MKDNFETVFDNMLDFCEKEDIKILPSVVEKIYKENVDIDFKKMTDFFEVGSNNTFPDFFDFVQKMDFYYRNSGNIFADLYSDYPEFYDDRKVEKFFKENKDLIVNTIKEHTRFCDYGDSIFNFLIQNCDPELVGDDPFLRYLDERERVDDLPIKKQLITNYFGFVIDSLQDRTKKLSFENFEPIIDECFNIQKNVGILKEKSPSRKKLFGFI